MLPSQPYPNCSIIWVEKHRHLVQVHNCSKVRLILCDWKVMGLSCENNLLKSGVRLSTKTIHPLTLKKWGASFAVDSFWVHNGPSLNMPALFLFIMKCGWGAIEEPKATGWPIYTFLSHGWWNVTGKLILGQNFFPSQFTHKTITGGIYKPH